MDTQIAKSLLRDVKKLEEKYSLSFKEIAEIAEKKDKISIPFSIFNKRLGSLESIVKYLKENLDLSFKEISFLTNRNIQPLRTTYNRSKQKHPKRFSRLSQEGIPLTIIQDKGNSVLENLVIYFLSKNFTFNEISAILYRDYKTIWTIKNRLREKAIKNG